MALTRKQQRFVDEYLIDLNATQAAIRAQYSAKTASRIGPELLGKTCVSEAIKKAQEKHAKASELTVQRILKEYAIVGLANISNYMLFGPGGLEVKDFSTIPKELLAAVSEITEVRTEFGGTVKLKFHNKIAALDSICKVLGFNGEGQADKIIPPLEIKVVRE